LVQENYQEEQACGKRHNNNKDVHNYRPAFTIKNSAAHSKGNVFWYHTWPIITQSGKQVKNISEQPDVPASG
jgi:hypothetical protein